MRPVSDEFLASLRIAHVIAAALELTFPGEPTPVSVPVEGGLVTIDRTAQHRRTGSVRIPWSLQAGEDLGVDLRTLTLGGYATPYRGLRYADGSTELVELGMLRVESVSWNTTDASASLELADRMAQVRDEPFTSPYTASGQTASQAAVGIVQGVFGSAIAYHTPYAPTDALADVIYTGARVDALSALEQGYGAATYFDAAGDFVFAHRPGDNEPVVWTLDAGPRGVMVAGAESLDRTGIYNGVLVKGQPAADAPPVSALATFDEPGSPIRWGGPFGKVCLITESSSVSTPEQAAQTAASLLKLRLKQTRQLDVTSAPNPALEADDTILVRFPDGREEAQLIDAVTVSLTTEAQHVITRSQSAPTAAQLPAPPSLYYGRAAWAQARDARLVAV